MNDLERAVIDAALEWCRTVRDSEQSDRHQRPFYNAESVRKLDKLREAVRALNTLSAE